MAPSIATKPLEHLLKRLIIRVGLTMARSRQGKDDVSGLASIFDCLMRRNDLREWESMRDRESRVANCRPLSYSFDCSSLAVSPSSGRAQVRALVGEPIQMTYEPQARLVSLLRGPCGTFCPQH